WPWLSVMPSTATVFADSLSLHDALPIFTAGTGIFFFASLMVLFVEGGNASLHDLLLRPVGWLGELPAAPIVAFGILLTAAAKSRSEEHTSELQSREKLVCTLLLEKSKTY